MSNGFPAVRSPSPRCRAGVGSPSGPPCDERCRGAVRAAPAHDHAPAVRSRCGDARRRARGSARRRCCASRSPTTSRIPEGSMCCSACSPADAQVSRLARRLAEALGLDASAVDADAPLGVLCGTLAEDATVPTCLLLDDSHDVPPDSPGGQLLRELLHAAPATHTSSWRLADGWPGWPAGARSATSSRSTKLRCVSRTQRSNERPDPDRSTSAPRRPSSVDGPPSSGWP